MPRWRSLSMATVVVSVTILGLSFLVFQAIAARIQRMTIDPTFDRMDKLQMESLRWQFENRGQKGLAQYMGVLDRTFTGSHYLLDGKGIDLLSGEDRSEMLPPPPAAKSRVRAHGHWVITYRSTDGKYWFAAIGASTPLHLETFLPYYFLVIGATAVLMWLAAVGVVVPIQKIATSIAAFGRGELSVRVQTKRSDEIGQLGRSFNDMAERLERLILSERRLLGDISHELRSPLARLKFAIKLARTSPDSQTALDRIERDVNRIASLVADIVEITTVEGDPAMRSTEPVSLGALLDEVVRDCSVEAEMRGSRIEVTERPDITVTGSRELLRRAVENVLRNAIRYSPDGSPIEIALSRVNGHACFTVRDLGPGVPEESLGRIFDPFFRVEEARNTNGGGSGLGLSIAKRATHAHHGAIVAENAKPGLRVRINLPMTPPESIQT